jgi:hypothetical protein
MVLHAMDSELSALFTFAQAYGDLQGKVQSSLTNSSSRLV